jgi:hypothetical protein
VRTRQCGATGTCNVVDQQRDVDAVRAGRRLRIGRASGCDFSLRFFVAVVVGDARWVFVVVAFAFALV